MPRSRDECWKEVTCTTPSDAASKRHPQVVCHHCGLQWTSNERHRVIEHLQRCPQLPDSLWPTYQPNRLDPSLPSAAELQAQQRARTRGIGAMSAAEQDSATSSCAQWVHSAGLSMAVTEHPAFRAFVHTLRPAFKVPTRQQLTHALVDAPLKYIAFLADPQGRQPRPAIVDGNEEAQSRSLQAFLIKYCDNNTANASALLGMMSLLRVRQGPFSNDNMVRLSVHQVTPIQWWVRFWIASQPELAALSIIALAIVPATDTLERVWSLASFVHVLKRNQLPQELITRLVCAFCGLRIKRGWVDENANGPAAAPVPAQQDAAFDPDMDGLST